MSLLSSVKDRKMSEAELVDFLTEYATEHNLPYAYWRLPDARCRYFILSDYSRSLQNDTIIEELPTGFVFAPFDKDRPSFFLPADLIFTFENGELSSNDDSISNRSISWLRNSLQNQKQHGRAKYAAGPPFQGAKGPGYEQLVRTCLDAIEKGSFEKIVPSRQHVIDLPAGFDVTHAFEKLCRRYTNALISLVSIPGTGTWITASPEILVTVENKTIFRTVALAGTKKFTEGLDVKSVSWTQKEIEEQALVERYVISCFKKIRLREYEEHGPRTVLAGNLLHLKTDFEVDMVATGFPQLGTIMLQLLHPTSAVCGMPLAPALQFLKEHEGYDRAFYSGYLGPVNVNSNIHLFVNLRCMQLLARQGVLYAGAGVTRDSIPSLELEETEMKFNTLRDVVLS